MYINTTCPINDLISRLDSSDSLKILGFHFVDAKLNVDLHIENLIRKFNALLWVVRILSRSGMNSEDMLSTSDLPWTTTLAPRTTLSPRSTSSIWIGGSSYRPAYPKSARLTGFLLFVDISCLKSIQA